MMIKNCKWIVIYTILIDFLCNFRLVVYCWKEKTVVKYNLKTYSLLYFSFFLNIFKGFASLFQNPLTTLNQKAVLSLANKPPNSSKLFIIFSKKLYHIFLLFLLFFVSHHWQTYKIFILPTTINIILLTYRFYFLFPYVSINPNDTNFAKYFLTVEDDFLQQSNSNTRVILWIFFNKRINFTFCWY